jgi:hypothetical protein
MLLTVLFFHVLAAISVGAIFTLPLLATSPVALHAVLVLLRFGAGATLLSGIALWVLLKPANALWLYSSLALFMLVVAIIGFVVAPAASASSEKPEMRRRIWLAGIASSALILGIVALMVLQPSSL